MILSQEWKDALWNKFVMAAPRPCTPSGLRYSNRTLRSLSGAESLGSPQGGRQVAQASTLKDQKTGPKEPRSTILSEDAEAMVVAVRRHSLLPLDDGIYALQASIPHLHCIVDFNGTGYPACRMCKATNPGGRRSSDTPICYFHIDIAEVRTEEGKLHLFVAIAKISTFAVAQLVDKANRKTAREFSEHI